MPRGTADKAETTKDATSRWLVTGTWAMTGTWATTAKTVVEHTGQMCEPEGLAVRSVQKWNCPPRKTIPKSNAMRRIR